MVMTADVRRFFEYLKTCKGKFFGMNVLTLPGFISIYLNYDTDYNPFRNAILNCSMKLEKEMTVDCLKFIKEHSEGNPVYSELNEEELLGKRVKVSKPLDVVLTEALNQKFDNLHEFMFFVLSTKWKTAKSTIVSYFERVYEVDFNEMMKIAKSRLAELDEEEEEYQLSENLSKYARVIDGKREDYKLFVGEDYKDTIWGNFLKLRTRSLILIIDHLARIEKYAYNMAYEVCHDISCSTRNDIVLIEVDVQKIVQYCVDEEEFVEAIQKAVENLLSLKDKEKLVIYLKNYNVLLKNRGNGFSYLFYTFPLFQDEELHFLIAFDEDEVKAVSGNNRFLYYFELFDCAIPEKEEFVPYILGETFSLVLYHGVYADKNDIERALQYVKALNFGGSINGTDSLLDFAMAYANSQGRNEILESDYMEHFKINFHEQEKQSLGYKMLVAYHEAGHFVVSRFCQHYKAIYSDLISTVSVSDTGGVNVLESDESAFESNDYNFYLESLAMELAGRASEELYLTAISAGAVCDLEQATAVATAMIAKFGLDKSKDFKIKGNENLKSEKSLNEVSEKVDALLEEAYELATEMLQEHEEYVHSLAQILLEKRIISRKEILSMEYEEDGKVLLRIEEEN
ncbi:MAG: hypothetical protein IJ629_01505 [Clostridia bacterium]|nr:hypothetical protein [Clostridia bacterium]